MLSKKSANEVSTFYAKVEFKNKLFLNFRVCIAQVTLW
ncbi:hypothetical protein M23134_08269 [Microscilla marina ATCC 23134]|uniref:Uncharacterized protein n=1 Tax=Microscilla marina ATCC 23134 TaxID=313606 RepID=A1ZQE5_MICM2|nr:hypothetical protein M23134_08269 [Microscilla marina ATCC 23134]